MTRDASGHKDHGDTCGRSVSRGDARETVCGGAIFVGLSDLVLLLFFSSWLVLLFLRTNTLQTWEQGVQKMSGRSDHASAILGQELFGRLSQTKVLLVGAGGIGCELCA